MVAYLLTALETQVDSLAILDDEQEGKINVETEEKLRLSSALLSLLCNNEYLIRGIKKVISSFPKVNAPNGETECRAFQI
jgi:hypothetical protein